MPTPAPLPTASELEILRVLWSLGTATVREIHDRLEHQRDTAYTTTLKLLQIMREKGLVTRDETARSHVYRARLAQGLTERRLVRDLARRLFGGSTMRLALSALSEERASAADLRQIRRLLAELEQEETE